MAQPTQTDPQFKLRMTSELKKQIEIAAIENNRSMNAEIVARLEAFAEYQNLKQRHLQTEVEKLTIQEELFQCRQRLNDYREMLKLANENPDLLKLPEDKPAKAKEPVRLTEEEKEELWEWILQRAKQSK